MYFINNGDTLYLNNFNYNTARLINALAQVVENNDGVVKPARTTGYIVNRQIDSSINIIEHRINALQYSLDEGRGDAEKIKTAIADYKKQVDELKKIDNSPREVSYLSYITFRLDGFYYYIQIDSNPFFEHYYQKTPIRDGKRSKDACLQYIGTETKLASGSTVDNGDWLYDCLFDYGCAEADIIEIANILFNKLVNSKPSEIHRDKKRVRVANTYNNSYHYETILEKERLEAVDF